MFELSSVRYGSFSVRAKFRSIVSGVNLGRISVHSVQVIRIGSLLPGLLAATLALGAKEDTTILICARWVVTPSKEESAQETNAVSVYEVQKEDWRQPLIDYLSHRKLQNDVRHKMEYPKASTTFSLLQ